MADELAPLANQLCFDLRKLWAMFGQVGIYVLDVDADQVTVEVKTRAVKWRGADLPAVVRNALVRLFRELVPVPILRVVYTNEADGVERDVRFLPFYSEALLTEGAPTAPLLLIEEVCDAAREECRESFATAWTGSSRS